jgi:hypothetical protein
MAKASSKQMVQIGQTSGVLTEEVKLVEIPVEEFKEKFPNAEVPKLVTEDNPVIEEIKEKAPEWASVPQIKKQEVELSNEEKIVAFIESRTGGDTVRLNEFLKSLYPLPQRNEPPLWLNQGTSKQIKVLLSKMQADGLISIVNNTHELLGKFYHAGEQQITQHRNLNNVEILAKK